MIEYLLPNAAAFTYWGAIASIVTTAALNINVYGQTAVVVGRWRAKGVNEGVPFDYAARYVSVWVKNAGAWRIVSDQSTEIN
ncbi:MAG: nuclear transport factor 2 family protein [Chloroflexi bacterium]|nr:nuclear transport factor 2 family protein [Chloroflexota bacterium]